MKGVLCPLCTRSHHTWDIQRGYFTSTSSSGHRYFMPLQSSKDANAFCNRITDRQVVGTFWWINISWATPPADKEQNCQQRKQHAGARSTCGDPSCTQPAIHCNHGFKHKNQFCGVSFLCYFLPVVKTENKQHVEAGAK